MIVEIEDILNQLQEHNPEAIEMVKKSYELANYIHADQKRASGEPYIIHPLSVAKNLLDMEVWDQDTICAALLHDCIEDSEEMTKEELERLINPEVAELVDGVTKISRLNFSTKEAQNMANTRKIVNGLTKDVRIILIKLADRLHNMRTLEYKTEFKQKENALETMELFAPLAYHIGAYRVKAELEDLSLKYLEPVKYQRLKELKEKIERDSKEPLMEMTMKISDRLQQQEMLNEIKIRTKNIYGIYNQLQKGQKLADIHDLYALKIMVQEVEQCYLTLGIVHNQYHPVNDKFKDYICNPKTNQYQSIHTTVFGPEAKLVQTQIRTFDMDKVASFGISALWNQKGGPTRKQTQENLKKRRQFGKTLIEMDRVFADNSDFVAQVKKELLTEKVYVYDTSGEVIELPKGATPVDFAYQLSTEIGNTMVGAVVNDQKVPNDSILESNDRVRIMTGKTLLPEAEELQMAASTTIAKQKIKQKIENKIE